MKNFVLVLLLLAVPALSFAQAGLPGVFSDASWEESRRGKLDSLLKHQMFQTSQVGMMVYDLTADKVLFSFNERQTMRPASTMKVLTAVTALDQLGGAFRFATSVGYRGEVRDSVLYGDICIKGGLDPLFSRDDMQRFSRMINEAGIKAVEGDIVIDQSMKDSVALGEGWCWDDDNPAVLPFVYHHSSDSCWFPIPYSGNVVERYASETTAIAGDTLVTIVLGEVSHGIRDVLEPMMKKSDNYFAETVFYRIGTFQSPSGSAMASHSAKAMARMIRKVGLNPEHYKIADGSGLSLYNYLSPELLAKVLRYAYRKKTVFSILSPVMPIAGEDGTLKRRMRKTVCQGNVYAKTGTVTGVISLAGYCTASNGHTLAFAIINQGVLKSKDARDFQDRVCMVLCGE